MPMLLEHIDAIARQKGRDVLMITFYPGARSFFGIEDEEEKVDIFDFDYKKSKARQKVIEWLNENKIVWQPCGEIANENMMIGYLGSVYLDVPFDPENETYRKLNEYLENPDGSSKVKGVTLWALTLELALKNKHHDEPGFWEKWAENF